MLGRAELAPVGALVAIGIACASACSDGDNTSATGGTAGAVATGGASGAAGLGGTSGDASTDADASDALPEGCVDIHVIPKMLPNPDEWYGTSPPIGIFLDRDHVWRDAIGVHVAWNVMHADQQAGEMVVSSFDATTGAPLGHRLFPAGGSKGFRAAALAPDGTVGLGVVLDSLDGGTGTPGLLLVRTDDATFEQLHTLPDFPQPNVGIVGVGWDGEAFAVHGFGDGNVQYVTRIKTDGTVLLPPTAFGQTFGYAEEVRYVTDPLSGVSYAVSGRGAGDPWLTGHLRDGTPIPDPTKIQGVKLLVQNPGNDWAGGVRRPSIGFAAGTAAVAWSANPGSTLPITTFVQLIDSTLSPSADAIGIAGDPLPPPASGNLYDSNEWLTIQPLQGGGSWIAGTNTLAMNEFVVDPAGVSVRRELVSYSNALTKFYVSNFESTQYGDELWLAFLDQTGPKTQPFRVVRVKPECTYESMFDLEGN